MEGSLGGIWNLANERPGCSVIIIPLTSRDLPRGFDNEGHGTEQAAPFIAAARSKMAFSFLKQSRGSDCE